MAVPKIILLNESGNVRNLKAFIQAAVLLIIANLQLSIYKRVMLIAN
jgi:hypothetical protein